MTAYDQYLAGDLINYSLSNEEIANNVSGLEHLV
jgi:tryptophan synthase beta chain